MAAKLKSVLRNRTLRLACKSAILIGLIFSFEYSRDSLYLFLFALAVIIFYFRPAVGNGRYIVPVAASLFIVLALPSGLTSEVYIYMSIMMGFVLALIIGLKNLFFIDKFKIHSLVNLTLASILIAFYFFGFLDFFMASSSIVLFIALFLIFRDLYRTDLASGVVAFVAIEFAWALSVLPVSVLWKAAVLIVILNTTHYLYARYLRRA